MRDMKEKVADAFLQIWERFDAILVADLKEDRLQYLSFRGQDSDFTAEGASGKNASDTEGEAWDGTLSDFLTKELAVNLKIKML